MDPPLSYQPYLDQLIAFASAEPRKPELLTAKAEYFQLTGEVFEDDKSFEMRMASFLEFYLFDRKHPIVGKTPAEELYEQKVRDTGAEEASAFRSFTETLHGLFEMRKAGGKTLRLRELFSGKDHSVTERRHLAGLEKGDILEARLIPHQGYLLFSGAFCYHPKLASKLIRQEIKRRRNGTESNPHAFAWECAKRALQADRYRQIAVEKIYNFQSPSPLGRG